MIYWFTCIVHGRFSKPMLTPHWYAVVCPVCNGPVVAEPVDSHDPRGEGDSERSGHTPPRGGFDER